MVSDEVTSYEMKEGITPRAINMILPLAVMIVMMLVSLAYTGWDQVEEAIFIYESPGQSHWAGFRIICRPLFGDHRHPGGHDLLPCTGDHEDSQNGRADPERESVN